ncbi:MAG: Smr/MutS family protein [Methylobacteriaceae bacterium]|nr:Smr/MutS family protein [Methylobacteriaceae bacterium]
MTRRRRRELTREELELWRRVTETVEPARPAPPEPPPAPPPAIAAAPAPAPRRYRAPDYQPPAPARPVGPPPLQALGRPLRQRLSRGRAPIDAAIDLHGMRQAEAHHALHAFLMRAHHEGARVVLVVTGKGAGAGPDGEAGVLRRLAPHWLRSPDWRALVLGFEAAGRGHGGEGALYVRLRRRRAS